MVKLPFRIAPPFTSQRVPGLKGPCGHADLLIRTRNGFGEVFSFRPSGNSIGSSKRLDQPLSAIRLEAFRKPRGLIVSA